MSPEWQNIFNHCIDNIKYSLFLRSDDLKNPYSFIMITSDKLITKFKRNQLNR